MLTPRGQIKRLHDPGGETRAQGCTPPSVGLEGERNEATSLHIEPNNIEVVETDNADVEGHHNHTQQLSRHPVGTTDGDKPRPNGPTEPPDEEEGEQHQIE
ncbi:hypothetical protein BDN67DRAFT_1016020 [Paxillus ammoniavirescens]|nr:hypothetical protein BDN67DRAFT_1016020 [Paxillus ammoniavirescens]